MSGDPSAWRRLSESLVEVETIELPTEVETPSEAPSAEDRDGDAPDEARADVDVVPEL